MERAGVETAVGKYLCSDVVVMDGREGRKGILVGEGGTQEGRRSGGHVGEPVEHGVVDRFGGEAGEGARGGTEDVDAIK